MERNGVYIPNTHICWSYDIECQHGFNRIARFKEWFPDLVLVVQRIVLQVILGPYLLGLISSHMN